MVLYNFEELHDIGLNHVGWLFDFLKKFVTYERFGNQRTSSFRTFGNFLKSNEECQ
jgi:hypothetical protein